MICFFNLQGNKMETHESWLNTHRWISYGALTVLTYYLLVEHREHVIALLPYLFFAACPLMHIFMHGGHHHDHKNDHRKQSEENKS